MCGNGWVLPLQSKEKGPVGVFGGSFDPPHVSHLVVCTLALALSDVERLLVVPCFQHALGKTLTPFEHRLAMSRLAFGHVRGVEVSAIESDLQGISYTVRTLEHIQRLNPGRPLRLIVGADAMAQRGEWRDFHRIEQMASIVVFGRDDLACGRATLPAPPPISATLVRQRLSEEGDVSGLVPNAVLRYIQDHGLYV